MESPKDREHLHDGNSHSSPADDLGTERKAATGVSSCSTEPEPLSSDNRNFTPFKPNDEFNLPNGHADHDSKPSKIKRIRSLRDKTKAKTKKLLKIHGDNVTHESTDEDVEGDGEVFDNIDGNPAFKPDLLVQKQPITVGGTADKTAGNLGSALRSAAAAVAHPRSAAKSIATKTTAGQLSKAERPYLSQEADAEFLKAHDDLHRADLSRGNADDQDADTKADAYKDRVGELEGHRESTRVAWITSRHVQRVRVVPNLHLGYPNIAKYEERTPDGTTKHHYGKWLGHLVIYYTQDFAGQYIDDFNELPFDIDTFRHSVERLIMASGPWQEWLMQIRMIYRWENPAKTAKWLFVFLVLWATEHIVGFVYGFILYTVIRNYYFPTDIKALRKSIERAADRGGTAYQFGELIDKHGRDEWLRPMIDTVGPFAQVQVGDVANLLEVLYNFYTWKSPKHTAATLFLIFVCLLVSVLTDWAFCMRIIWFVSGGAFFLCWPISSCYPKYRYLVSPTKWILWGIPTHAEWSFQYLRRQAQLSREAIIRQKVDQETPATQSYTGKIDMVPATPTGPLNRNEAEAKISSENEDEDDDGDDWHSVVSSSSILSGSEVKSYRCQYLGTPGHLVIYSAGLRFIRSLPSKKQLWHSKFTELVEMRKLEGTKVGKLAKLEQLELSSTDGEVITIQSLKNRDEVFNMIIGFSGLRWQSLQTGPGPGKTGDGKSGGATPW